MSTACQDWHVACYWFPGQLSFMLSSLSKAPMHRSHKGALPKTQYCMINKDLRLGYQRLCTAVCISSGRRHSRLQHRLGKEIRGMFPLWNKTHRFFSVGGMYLLSWSQRAMAYSLQKLHLLGYLSDSFTQRFCMLSLLNSWPKGFHILLLE